ncbi:MAG: hypothetical protein [Wendovervirus sonii]|uniref:Uncharacterized protein n=1 Tax=phage Lak_Megaphage_Sonny TaxID=3109229 RepID=A0ABZ0Z6E5_9CAUD|nr:MAG: hypothetical protein [phage Lak_Megaphage_Sonny]
MYDSHAELKTQHLSYACGYNPAWPAPVIKTNESDGHILPMFKKAH